MTLGQATVPSSHTPSHTDNNQATTPTAAAAAAAAASSAGGSSSAEKPASYTHTHPAKPHCFSKPPSSSSTHQQLDLDKVWEATKSFDIDDNGSPTNHNSNNSNTRPPSSTLTATTTTTDPGLLFASNQSNITTTTAATTNMDFQNIEAESLLSAAAQRRSRRLVYMCGFCASLTSILLGYDVGIMSVARKYVDKQLTLSSVQSEVVMGSLNLIAAFGGLIAGKTADHFGRNRAIAIACLIFLTGSACMTLAWNFRVLLVGRVVTGLGVGCGFVIAPVYIAEICPPEIRGRMVSLTDVCINVGIVLGSIVGFLCEQTIISDDVKWRVMLGIGIIPPIVILLCLRFLPESPRWLLLKDRVPEARHVLKMIVGREQEAEREFIAIEETIALERDVTTDWSEVLWPRHRAILLPVLMGLALGFFQQASGSEAAVYYSPQILAEVGVVSTAKQSLGNIAVSVFKFAGELIAMFSMDLVGRKPLFVTSAVGSGVFLILCGFVFKLHLSAVWLVASLCLFMGFFSVGMGAITFVVASELFPLPVRGKAMALTVFVNRLLSGVVALSFLSMVEALSYANTFFLFALFSFVSTVFYGLLLPETKGKTLEEISMLFEKESAAHDALVLERRLSHERAHGHRRTHTEVQDEEEMGPHCTVSLPGAGGKGSYHSTNEGVGGAEDERV